MAWAALFSWEERAWPSQLSPLLGQKRVPREPDSVAYSWTRGRCPAAPDLRGRETTPGRASSDDHGDSAIDGPVVT